VVVTPDAQDYGFRLPQILADKAAGRPNRLMGASLGVFDWVAYVPRSEVSSAPFSAQWVL